MASTNELLSQLTNFECYYSDGQRFLGMVDIELPELKFMTAEIQGAGVTGKIEMPTQGHTEPLELTINFRNVSDDVSKLSEQKAIDLSFYGAQHVYNYRDARTIARRIKIDIRGFIKNTPLGSFKVSELTETKVTFELIYIKVEIDGTEYWYIDKLNYIFRVNRVDYLSDTRRALGLDTTLGDVIQAVLS